MKKFSTYFVKIKRKIDKTTPYQTSSVSVVTLLIVVIRIANCREQTVILLGWHTAKCTVSWRHLVYAGSSVYRVYNFTFSCLNPFTPKFKKYTLSQPF